jgi:hypothetical protein
LALGKTVSQAAHAETVHMRLHAGLLRFSYKDRQHPRTQPPAVDPKLRRFSRRFLRPQTENPDIKQKERKLHRGKT